MANVVRHERYASVDLEYLQNNSNLNLKGSNKQWWATVYDDGTFLAQYGKITGTEPAASSEKKFGSVAAANDFMDKKIKEKEKLDTDKKTGMKTQYVRVPVADEIEALPGKVITSQNELAQVAKDQIAQGDPIVAELVGRLAKENVHNIMSATAKAGMTYNDTTGLFSTPMGVVTQEKIDEARDLLAALTPLVQKGQFADQAYIHTVQDYMKHVPMDLGHRRVEIASIFPDVAAIAKQGDILEALEASLKMVSDRALAAAISGGSPVVVEPPKVFDVKMSLIAASKEIDKFRKMYRDTMKDQHGLGYLDVRRVFTVDIRTMRELFEKQGLPLGGLRQLWHGTRVANLLSILKVGLTIPPRNCYGFSGRMYGDGCYFAPASSKSLQYSRGSGDLCYMFLADVAMGNAFTPRGACQSAPSGYHSIWAKGSVSGVVNDEIIVPNVHQCNLVYLLEFSRGGK